MALNLKTIGKTIGPLTHDYDWKDLVLYALGVGAGFEDLEYCYEDRLKVIPSISVASVFEFLAKVGIESNANLAGILHGEQDIVFHQPIPKEGTLTTEGSITNIYDMGDKGALVLAKADTWHSNGDKLFTNEFTLFCRLDGGFGGEAPPKETFEFPDRPPDFTENGHPSPDQPLVYRLSGDIFALHINPDFAKASGFDKPIMHGLCTHGYACRAVIKHLFPGEPERMTRFKNRFSKTLYPGIPIVTQIWKESDGRALFRVVNQENEQVVIDRGIVEWVSADELKERKKKKGIRLDDQVAIVTGAGAGLGRAYALELAKRGAKVVVNDLGGARDGSGASTKAADMVVEEIKKLGGEAVANYDSVADPAGGQAIVDTAVKAFGRVDILINNAGILRDKTLPKMEPAVWDAVLDVHLNGAYNVTRPAYIKMRENGYGRIVMTTSAAGLYGNFGQTNYSAAKMGLVGIMNTLKHEGLKHDIRVNTVAPVAATRLTEDVMPPDMLAKLKPEYVMPLVIYMCSKNCKETGQIFNAGAGFFSRVAIVTGAGAVVGDGKTPPTPELIAKNWDEIANMRDLKEFASATEALGPMLTAFSEKKEEAKPAASGPSPQSIFDRMPEAFRADKAEGVDSIFQYKISGDDGGEWHMIIKDNTCVVNKGLAEKPTTTILMSAEDFVALIEGRLNAMAAYTEGKLKIEGDIMASQLIGKLFKF